MNYYALDEALKYLDDRESVNENGDVAKGIFAIIGAILVGIIFFIKGKELKSDIDLIKAVKSSESQSKFKSLFDNISKALRSALKSYDKFIKYNSYSYKYSTDKKAKEIVVKFPICVIKAEDLFEDTYKMDMDEYNKDFNEAEDYGKSAPKFKTRINEINSISKSICQKFKTGAVTANLGIPESDLKSIDKEYIYFDNGDSGPNSRLEIVLTLVFKLEDLKSKEK